MKKYVVYDTKHKVYNLGQETMTGLGMRSWGYDKSRAEQLTKRQAEKLAQSHANCEVQEALQ